MKNLSRSKNAKEQESVPEWERDELRARGEVWVQALVAVWVLAEGPVWDELPARGQV